MKFMQHSRRISVLMVGTVLGLAAPEVVFAQVAPAATAEAAPASGAEIIVTAQRRAERLENVPISLMNQRPAWRSTR